jgi:hypothetical protein
MAAAAATGRGIVCGPSGDHVIGDRPCDDSVNGWHSTKQPVAPPSDGRAGFVNVPKPTAPPSDHTTVESPAIASSQTAEQCLAAAKIASGATVHIAAATSQQQPQGHATCINALTRGKRRRQQTNSQDPAMIRLPSSNSGLQWSLDQLKQAQADDPVLSIVSENLRNGSKPTRRTSQEIETQPELSFWVLQWESLQINNHVVYRRYYLNNGNIAWLQYETPQSLRKEIFNKIHCDTLLHARSFLNNIDAIRRAACWPHQSRDVRLFLHDCVVCLSAKGRIEKPVGKISCRSQNVQIMQRCFLTT